MPIGSGNSKYSLPFSPQSIPGLNMWLDAADANTMFTNTAGTTPVATSGASIAAWKDKSSNGYLFTQGTSGNQPTYTKSGQNGLSVTSWNGSQILQSSTTIPFFTSTSSGGSFFVVFQASSIASQRFLLNYQNSPSTAYCTAGTELGYSTGAGLPGNFGVHTGCGNAAVSLTQITANTYALMNLNMATTGTAPSNITIFKNGSQQSVQSDGSGYYSVGSYPSSNNARYLMIGGRNLYGYSGPESMHSGTIAEFLWFTSPLTTLQQQQIEGYLANKWGLQSTLPATHPFTTNYRASVSGLVWKDKSSASNNMSLISGNPTYSAASMAVNIPSGTILQTTNYVTVTANVTGIFIVCQATSLPAAGLGYVFNCSDINSGDSSVRFYPNTTTLDNGFGGTTFYINGASYTSGTNSLGSGYNIIYAMPTGQSGSTRLSISTSFLSRYFIGNIQEIIVFTSAITSTQRQQVETYLSSKWNIPVATSVSGLSSPTSISGCSLWLDGADTSTFISQTFSPTNISGCKLWLDGADTSSMTFSGTSITQWNDKSGSGYNATVASGKTAATYSSSYKAVNFPASTTGYVTSYPANPSTETMFVVANNASPSGNNNIVIGGQKGARSLGFGYSGANGSTAACAYLNNEVTWCATTPAGSYTAGTTAIISGYVNGSSSYISINGGGFSTAGATGFYSGTTTYLGVDTTTPIYYFIGLVMEVIFYNSVLTSTQIAQVNTYLQQKWNTSFQIIQPSAPFVARPFIPTDITGCQLWLDGLDSSSITSSSSVVSAWNDKSGNGNNGTAVGSPTVSTQGRNQYVYFNGSSGFRGAVSITGTQITTFAVIIFPSAQTVSARIVSLGVTNAVDWNNQLYSANLYISPPAYVATYRNGGTNINTTASTNPRIASSMYDGTNSYIYLDGVVSSAYGSSGSFGVTNYGVGTNSDSASTDYFTGYIGEVIVYNTTFTTVQRQQIEGYLAWKWGLPASLASTHPGYKLPSYTPLFNPKSISNLVLWLDAADKATLTMSGSNVSAWYDKSGSGYSAVPLESVTFPLTTQNGNSAVYLNGARMYISNFNWNNQFTVFYVCNAYYGGALVGFGASTESNAAWLGYTSPGNWALFSLGAVNTTDPNYTTAGHPAPVVNANQWCIFSIGYNLGTTVTNYAVNGTARTANSFTAFAAGSQTGVLFLNGLPSGAYDYVQFGDFLHFNKSLTTTERQQVEGYLAWKWGLNGNLPSTHPYSKFAP